MTSANDTTVNIPSPSLIPVGDDSDPISPAILAGVPTVSAPSDVPIPVVASKTVQAENLKAEMKEKANSLSYAIAAINTQIDSAETKHSQRITNLTNNHNALVEDLTEDHEESVTSLKEQLTDFEEALAIVKAALAPASV